MSEKPTDLKEGLESGPEAEGSAEERSESPPEVAEEAAGDAVTEPAEALQEPQETQEAEEVQETQEAEEAQEVEEAQDSEEPQELAKAETPAEPQEEESPEADVAEEVAELEAEEASPVAEEVAELEAEEAPPVAEEVTEAEAEETPPVAEEVAEAETVEAEEAEGEEAPSEEEEEEPIITGPVVSSGPGKDWYVVHTYSGYEAKVKASLEERVNALGLKDQISQILVPSEQVVEVKGGKKRISARKFFPGYILVEMELSDETWYLIKNTPKVTGFLGGGRHPTPLPLAEVEFIIEQMRGEAEKPKPRILFERGENVRIVDGPFSNFTGVIEEVDEVRGKLRVMVTIFGRTTPVEMEFLQVEKV